MKGKSVLILIIISIISTFSVYAAGFGFDPPNLCDISLTAISWPTGILGKCPDGGGYSGCCYDGATCGVLIDGTCTPDADVSIDPSATQVVQYYVDNSLNDGVCATQGPTTSCPGCYDVDLSATVISCSTTSNGDYCTNTGEVSRNRADEYAYGAIVCLGSISETSTCPTTSSYCRSFRVANRNDISACNCPPEGCVNSVCKASYACIADPQLCVGAPAPVTVTLATCSDSYKNQDETDLDCGGPCIGANACANSKNCVVNPDCQSNNCVGGVCQGVASCLDVTLNGDETDVDCGGSCPGCNEGLNCNVNSDCQSNNCQGGTCAPAALHCENSVQDQDETGVDCGGIDCAGCCGVLATAWSGPDGEILDPVPEGIPAFPVILTENCEGATLNFELYQTGAPVASSLDGLNPTTIEFVQNEEFAGEVGYSQLETAGLSGTFNYRALLVLGLQNVEQDSSDIQVSSICTVVEPTACDLSILDPSDPAMTGPPFIDSDCDGVPDCMDGWSYGVEEQKPMVEVEKQVNACSGNWDCSLSPWTECQEVDAQLVQTRLIRPCGGGVTENCCQVQANPCQPPPSQKVCLQDEEFPIFSFTNLLVVVMMLGGFYTYRTKKKF